MPRKNEQPNFENIPEAVPVTEEEAEKVKQEGRYIDTSKEAGDWIKNNEGVLEFHKKEELKNSEKIETLKQQIRKSVPETEGGDGRSYYQKQVDGILDRIKRLDSEIEGEEKKMGVLKYLPFGSGADNLRRLKKERQTRDDELKEIRRNT